MDFFTKVDGVCEKCEVIQVAWEEKEAKVRIEDSDEKRTTSLYNMAMQTSLHNKVPFEEVVEYLHDIMGESP